MNHSLAFTTSYNIARNAFQDDTTAGKIFSSVSQQLVRNVSFLEFYSL